MDKQRVTDVASLRKGAEDFRYLLGRGFPRKNCLDLIGNRYGFKKDERELLHRGVFAPEDAARRKEKLFAMEGLEDGNVAVDGYNVIITVESALRWRPLIAADDGLIRDIAGISSAFKIAEVTHKAIHLVMEILSDHRPKRVDFLFDSPISRSGRLASLVADCIGQAGLVGEARAVRVPEKILIGYRGVVATSDSAIIDEVERVVDVAGQVIRTKIPEARLIKL
ncbi:MAG: DUF434 domain-containing protein [Proteobacteria bacterium]|nr:DUF434 domain-containing protein [Pseudomonadota bacterium]